MWRNAAVLWCGLVSTKCALVDNGFLTVGSVEHAQSAGWLHTVSAGLGARSTNEAPVLSRVAGFTCSILSSSQESCKH